MTQEEISPEHLQKGQIWNKPKIPLMLQFEKETNRKAILLNGVITGRFTHWLFKKGLKKSNFSEVNQTISKKFKEVQSRPEVKENHSKAMEKVWHKPGYRKIQLKKIKEAMNRPEVKENQSIKMTEIWHRPGYRESRSGENHHHFGKFGVESYAFKENAGETAKHNWIRIHYPQKEFCNDKCEVCGKINLSLNLARFLHINVRNIDNPMIDYFYICSINEKNSCHQIYDRLNDITKEILLEGAITREEKLKRVREYVMEIKD